MLLSWKFYYSVRVGKTHNQYFSLTRWQRTSGATYEPQAGADMGKYIFRGGRQYLILTHHLIITIILYKKKGSGIFYVTFEVPTSLSHLSFHLRLQRVNTLLCFQEVLEVVGVCITYNTLSCSGKLPRWQKCLCGGNIRKKKSLHPRRKPQQTWLVTRKGVSGGKDRTSQLFSDQSLTESRVGPVDASSFGIRTLLRGDWNDYEFMTKMAEGWKETWCLSGYCHLSEAWIESLNRDPLCAQTFPRHVGVTVYIKWVMSVSLLVMDWQTGQSVSLVYSWIWLAPARVNLHRKDNRQNEWSGETDREALWDKVKREVTTFSDPKMYFCCLFLRLKQRLGIVFRSN